MRTRSVNWGLSSLLHRRLMSLMHRSVCWTSNIICGCCEHLTHTFWWPHGSSVMLNGLELRHRRRFRNVAEHMRCFEGWNWDFRLVPMSRGIRPPMTFLTCKLRRKAQLLSLCSDCLSTTIIWIEWELIFQIRQWWFSKVIATKLLELRDEL